MITFLIGLLTVLLVLSCLLLMLLVLVQLPKKEAGAGMAFGAGTADALLGAGSGNALTKITKYVAAAFFVFAITLSLAYSHSARKPLSEVQKALQQQAAQKPAPAPVAPAPAAGNLFGSGNSLLTTNLPAVESTNAAKPVAPR